MAKKHCEHCGAPLDEHRHGLSKGLARGLYRLVQAGGGPINLNDIGLNYNQQSNFQKLKYWGLVEKSDPNCLKGGEWNITAAGWNFVKGDTRVPKYAITFRGAIVKYEGEQIRITDITDGWMYRSDYVAMSRPHVDSGLCAPQPALI